MLRARLCRSIVSTASVCACGLVFSRNGQQCRLFAYSAALRRRAFRAYLINRPTDMQSLAHGARGTIRIRKQICSTSEIFTLAWSVGWKGQLAIGVSLCCSRKMIDDDDNAGPEYDIQADGSQDVPVNFHNRVPYRALPTSLLLTVIPGEANTRMPDVALHCPQPPF